MLLGALSRFRLFIEVIESSTWITNPTGDIVEARDELHRMLNEVKNPYFSRLLGNVENSLILFRYQTLTVILLEDSCVICTIYTLLMYTLIELASCIFPHLPCLLDIVVTYLPSGLYS
jgi:hypothetical protein